MIDIERVNNMEKKHMALLCGVFYPEPSPTGTCAKRFVELLSEEYDIDIICISENGIPAKVMLPFQNVEIPVHLIGCKRVELEEKNKGVKKRILHALGGVQIKTRILGNLSWYRRKALIELEHIHNEKKLDVIFSVCSPMAAHFAAADMKKKHPEIRHCGYTVDPYSAKNRIRPIFVSQGKLVSFEKSVLEHMDHILLSEEVVNNRKDLIGKDMCYDVLPYMLPELREVRTDEQFYTTNGVNCVYAGRFYNDIRNPEYLLKIFAGLEGINLHLFSVGCENITERYSSQYPNIILHKMVSNERIGAVYEQADVLVGLGNATADFFPSKTYEYIAAGKPIVYCNHKHMKNSTLENYPMSLQISDNDDSCIAAGKVVAFCKESKGKVMDRKEIIRRYADNSPKEIKKILLRAIRGDQLL